MSDILEADDMFDESAEAAGEVVDDQVGMTSEEAGDSTDADQSETEKKKSKLSGFSIYDSMLLVSLICVSLATLVLFLELNKFGSILEGEFPWRASEFRK